jgi:hypothetical protein
MQLSANHKLIQTACVTAYTSQYVATNQILLATTMGGRLNVASCAPSHTLVRQKNIILALQ